MNNMRPLWLFCLMMGLSLSSCVKWNLEPLDHEPDDQAPTAPLAPDLEIAVSRGYLPNGTYSGTVPVYYDLSVSNRGDEGTTGVVAEFSASNPNVVSPATFSIGIGEVPGKKTITPDLVSCTEGYGSYAQSCGTFSLRLNHGIPGGKSVSYQIRLRDDRDRTWQQTLTFSYL